MNDILDTGLLEQSYELASKNKRFVNYLIDMVCFYILVLILGALLAAFMFSIDPETTFFDEDNVSSDLIFQLIAMVVLFMYYFAMEYFLNGKTIGKYITKTRSVTIDNYRMSARTVMLRSLSRIVPFEAFSYLGSSPLGWHDKWTQTKVIEDQNWRN